MFLPSFSMRNLLAGLFLLAVVAPVRADLKNPETPRKNAEKSRKDPEPPRVPIARAVQAEAVRGFPVEIRLHGVTASPRLLQFILRQLPKQGRLEGPPAQAGKDSAVVRYVPDPAYKAEVDTFSYAVKVDGSGSSEDAVVTIRLSDPVAVLETPGGVDVGRVLATETVEHPLPVINKGNAVFKTTVPLPDGWTWAVPAGGRFEVEPGGRIDAVVRVKVKEAGPIDQKVTLQAGTVVRFIGHALPPFLGYPSLLRLQWERGSALRSYRFTIRNNRPEPLTVQLKAPPGVVVPASVVVPVAESVDVKVACTGELDRALSGQIRLDAPGWTQDVNYEAPVAPAVVEVTGDGPEGRVDFGILENVGGSAASRQVTLRNVGGTAAVIRWDPLRFFVVEGLEPESVLPPQEQRQITLRPHPEEPGRLKEELILRMTGGDHTLRLFADIDPAAAKAALMSGTVLKELPAATPGSTPAPARPPSGKALVLRGMILGSGLMEAIPNTDRSLASVDAVNLVAAEPERIIFDWEAPGPGTWTYRVMVRMLRSHGKGQAPIPEYDQMDNVKVTATATGGRAEVTKLRPGARWTCRIVAIRSDGVATKAGDELTFLTPPVGESRWGWRVLGVLSVISLVLYVRQKWREDVKWKD